MITLSCRPLHGGESAILLRGAFFRIGADGILRGPDNAVAARYAAGTWRLARSVCVSLECHVRASLRVTSLDGARTCIGPYESLKVAANGAVFNNDLYLGAHLLGREGVTDPRVWREITILSASESQVLCA